MHPACRPAPARSAPAQGGAQGLSVSLKPGGQVVLRHCDYGLRCNFRFPSLCACGGLLPAARRRAPRYWAGPGRTPPSGAPPAPRRPLSPSAAAPGTSQAACPPPAAAAPGRSVQPRRSRIMTAAIRGLPIQARCTLPSSIHDRARPYAQPGQGSSCCTSVPDYALEKHWRVPMCTQVRPGHTAFPLAQGCSNSHTHSASVHGLDSCRG